jgi:hypothetical protein
MENRKILKQRLYFFVPYNISPIQQAIQAGHAALEYAFEHGKSNAYVEFMLYDKTWIILNGGTTNKKRDLTGKVFGTLNQIGDELLTNKIRFSYFEEPDLNDALTAICFLADERVWDYETYPDIDVYLKNQIGNSLWLQLFRDGPWNYADCLGTQVDLFLEWEKIMGGPKNVFLRELLKGKKLA